MSKIDDVVQRPYTEEDNYTQGKGADATTPKKMGPAVGHARAMQNPTRSGGVNRPTSPGNAPRG